MHSTVGFAECFAVMGTCKFSMTSIGRLKHGVLHGTVAEYSDDGHLQVKKDLELADQVMEACILKGLASL